MLKRLKSILLGNKFMMAIILYFAAAIFLALIKSDLFTLLEKIGNYFTIFITFIAVLFSIISYLEHGRKSDSSEIHDENLGDFEKYRSFIENEVLKQSVKDANQNTAENINELIAAAIESQLNNNSFTDKIFSKFPPEIDIQRKYAFIKEEISRINNRIDKEIIRLVNSANLNLAVGTTVTITAVVFLGVEVFKYNLDFTQVVVMLSHYIPRLTFVIFIEIFAFFFLKMYKTNLSEIKYFHNEKTNIELILISLKVAMLNGSDVMLLSCIEQLSKTERNFILNNGQTTISLETNKLDGKFHKELLDGLNNLLQSIKIK